MGAACLVALAVADAVVVVDEDVAGVGVVAVVYRCCLGDAFFGFLKSLEF